MPIHADNVNRVKQLTSQYYSNAQQQGNQHQQHQAPPQHLQQGMPEQDQQAGPEHEQQNQQQPVSPILRDAVQLPPNVALNEPTDEAIRRTYRQIGVPLENKQRKSILSSGRKNFTIQEKLARKATEQQSRPLERMTVTLEQAISLSDAYLVKNFGKYQGEGVDRYLYLRYSLISNKYYALLPKDVSSKLSREELVQRLAKLYSAAPAHRDPELISFYENLVRVKDIETSVNAAPLEAPLLQYPTEISAEEQRSNDAVFDRNVKILRQGEGNEDVRAARLSLMEKIMHHGQNPGTDFLQQSNFEISPEQKEGIRQCLAWMYRNSCKTSHSKLAFVHKLASAKPEKILLALYLIEKGLQDSPKGDEFYEAVDYIPDFAKFKSRLVASKWKFWKRLGSDSQDDVVNWSALGTAVRYATQGSIQNPSVIDNYSEYTGQITTLNDQIDHDGGNALAKRNHLVQLLVAKGNLILTYYRSAGMHPDMPIDMIPNEQMRAEVQQTLGEITENLREVQTLSESLPEDQQQVPNIAYGNPGQAEQNKKKAAGPSGFFTALGKVVKPLSVLSSANLGMGIAKDHYENIKDFLKTTGYSVSSLTLGGVTGIIGLIMAIKGASGLADTMDTLSLADTVAQTLQTSGSLMTSAGSTTVAASKIYNAIAGIKDTPAATAPWYGTTETKTVGETFGSFSGTAQYIAGTLSIAAGLAMTVAGGVQIGRAVSSGKDLDKVRTRLNAIGDEHLSDAQKKIRSFMNHQDRKNVAHTETATAQVVTGILTMAGGVLTATGILAPIGGAISILSMMGNLGYGLFRGRALKRKSIKATVDENLNITDAAVAQAKAANQNLARMSNDKVRTLMRQEAMGVMGFASYKECYAHYMKEYAEMLFDNVMKTKRNENPDWDMYHNSLKSLGMEIDIRRKKPNAATIYAKLMK